MNWIQNIGKLIKTTLQSARKPGPSIPPILLLCEIMNRPGLSAIALTSAIIAKMETNGFHTGVNPDGSENMDNKFIRIVAEETIKHIKTYGRVEIYAGPMSISFMGTGGNAGGPTVITGYNPTISQNNGIPI
jgi:hypothetical protein